MPHSSQKKPHHTQEHLLGPHARAIQHTRAEALRSFGINLHALTPSQVQHTESQESETKSGI